jgi:DNA-binding CsgD family transcriptional regulator
MQLYAAEAAGQAAHAHQKSARPRDARRSATRAHVLSQHHGGASTPALATARAPGLSEREREIAWLASTGLSSVEIARRLVISPRTVENHLHRVFAKLGITARTQLSDTLGSPSNQ